ncbi:MAG: hypothetical protein MUE73_00865 [Planctomycetes bacterium]|jgi:hypothetical protein|nr:hypothetical protein [Planctomycetota bacterium]
MPSRTISDVISWLEELFDRHGVTRSYGGAIARNFHAMPRLTKDIEDIKAMLAAQAGKLDLARIRAGAAQLLDTASTEELEALIRDFCR